MKNSLSIGIPYTKVTDTTIHTSQIMPRLSVTNSHVFMSIYKHLERVMMWGASGADPCFWSSWWPTLVYWGAFSASVLCMVCSLVPALHQSPTCCTAQMCYKCHARHSLAPCVLQILTMGLHMLLPLLGTSGSIAKGHTQVPHTKAVLSHLPFANFSQAPALQSLPEAATKAPIFSVACGFLQGSRPLNR